MQCSGNRGVWAMVQSGKLICGRLPSTAVGQKKKKTKITNQKWEAIKWIRKQMQWNKERKKKVMTFEMSPKGKLISRVGKGFNTWGGNRSKVHSMQAFIPGNITRTLPLNPSVPPSTNGIMLPHKRAKEKAVKTKWSAWEYICWHDILVKDDQLYYSQTPNPTIPHNEIRQSFNLPAFNDETRCSHWDQDLE